MRISNTQLDDDEIIIFLRGDRDTLMEIYTHPFDLVYFNVRTDWIKKVRNIERYELYLNSRVVLLYKR